MLDALQAFSLADFFLATNRLSDPNQPIKTTRHDIQKSKETNLAPLQKFIYVLKQDMTVSIHLPIIGGMV